MGDFPASHARFPEDINDSSQRELAQKVDLFPVEVQ